MATVRHRVFARFYERLSRARERDLGEYRDELLAGLAGRVLEIGAGNGMNFQHYPSLVEEVVALEPEPYLRERALQAAEHAPVRVSVGDATADPLPLDAASVESELRRVLKPGGERLHGACAL